MRNVIITAAVLGTIAVLTVAGPGVAPRATAVSAVEVEPLVPLAPIEPSPPGGDGELRIEGGTADERRIVVAAHRLLLDAGLDLPYVTVTVDTTGAACKGYDGLYRSNGERHEVGVCAVTEVVVLHELAHAWDGARLTDEQRSVFLDHTGLESWSDPGVEWKRRGTERAANTIAIALGDGRRGCSGPLADAYEFLTGQHCSRTSAG